MGVPQFYRWLSERYPCLCETISKEQVPEFDNLYLDMNGIIHPCAHPDDDDVCLQRPEAEVFDDIAKYIQILFQIINPKKVLFLAVDGVAPRAKMSQQRSRRFVSSKNASDAITKAEKSGSTVQRSELFDSNCITPGTEFMDRLHNFLIAFVRHKIKTDEAWKSIKVYLSGHDCPGEGEHKIMEFIRYMKARPDYEPNMRHCLYGLDADLIILGTCSHEPHFTLLREEVSFTRHKKNHKKRKFDPADNRFLLLHVSLLREYIDMEFGCLKKVTGAAYNLEAMIDDWVLMTFLVGNDFIPHLPQMHIRNAALPCLFKAYKNSFPEMKGFINEKGFLNVSRLKIFLKSVSEIEKQAFEEELADLHWLASKTGSEGNILARRTEVSSAYSDGLSALIIRSEAVLQAPEEEYDDLDEAYPMVVDDGGSSTGSSDEQFYLRRVKYYQEKLKVRNVDRAFIQEQGVKHIRALQWILHYYYHGVCSWGWFYSQHYAPYATDVLQVEDVSLEFDIGAPFLPFEQLLAVLPPASSKLLPKPYQELMTDETSQLYPFYPTEFETDLNGKKNDWEAVVLLPFIDEDLLLKSARAVNHQLNDDEKRRNSPGFLLCFRWGVSDLNKVYRDVEHRPDVICERMSPSQFRIDRSQVICGLAPGVKIGIYFPGYPTFQHLTFESAIRENDVSSFRNGYVGERIVLKVKTGESENIESLVKKYLGEVVYVNWPQLKAALCVKICSENKCFVSEKAASVEGEPVNASFWEEETQRTMKALYNDRAIVVKDVSVLFYCQPLTGRRYEVTEEGEIVSRMIWSNAVLPFPSQIVVKNLLVDQVSLKYTSLRQMFPVGSTVFVLHSEYYGSEGVVVEHVNKCNVVVSVKLRREPDLFSLRSLETAGSELNWYCNRDIAELLHISTQAIGRITGTVLVDQVSPKDHQFRHNIGLDLKYNRLNKEIPDYSHKDEYGTWWFSEKVLSLISEYTSRFPEVYEYLCKQDLPSVLHFSDIWPAENENRMRRFDELRQWLKALPTARLSKMTSGTEYASEDEIQRLEDLVARNKGKPVRKRLSLHPAYIYRCVLFSESCPAESDTSFRVFDRVVNVKNGSLVPVGLRGTVVAVLKTVNGDISKLDVLFDEQFQGAESIRGSKAGGYRVDPASLLNLSYQRARKSSYKPQSSSARPTVHKLEARQVETNRLNHTAALPSPSIEVSSRYPHLSASFVPASAVAERIKADLGIKAASSSSASRVQQKQATSEPAFTTSSTSQGGPLLPVGACTTRVFTNRAMRKTTGGQVRMGGEALFEQLTSSLKNVSFEQPEPCFSWNPRARPKDMNGGLLPPSVPQPCPPVMNYGSQPLPGGFTVSSRPCIPVNQAVPALPSPGLVNQSYRLPPPVGRPCMPFYVPPPMRVATDGVNLNRAMLYGGVPVFQQPNVTGHMPARNGAFVPLQTRHVFMNDDMILVECSDDEAYNPAGLPDRKVWIPTVENVKSMLEKMKSSGVDGFSDNCFTSETKEFASTATYSSFRSGFDNCSHYMARNDGFNSGTAMNAPSESPVQRNPSLMSWKQN